jgi:hypothetical protein
MSDPVTASSQNLIDCPWCRDSEPLPDTPQNRLWIVRHQNVEHRAELGLPALALAASDSR